MKSVKGIFIFVIGVITGTFAGAQIAKKKYEEIANEEIDEIRAYYKEREKEVKEVEEPKQEESYIPTEERVKDEEIKELENLLFSW